jgi:hypothetical protein
MIKTFFAGDNALKADGAKNTSDQFESKKMNQNVNLFKKNNFYIINDKGNMITCCLFIFYRII